jgi:hypothetical protein
VFVIQYVGKNVLFFTRMIMAQSLNLLEHKTKASPIASRCIAGEEYQPSSHQLDKLSWGNDVGSFKTLHERRHGTLSSRAAQLIDVTTPFRTFSTTEKADGKRMDAGYHA